MLEQREWDIYLFGPERQIAAASLLALLETMFDCVEEFDVLIGGWLARCGGAKEGSPRADEFAFDVS